MKSQKEIGSHMAWSRQSEEPRLSPREPHAGFREQRPPSEYLYLGDLYRMTES